MLRLDRGWSAFWRRGWRPARGCGPGGKPGAGGKAGGGKDKAAPLDPFQAKLMELKKKFKD